MNELFDKIAHKVSEIVGSSWAFILALVLVIIWIFSGHLFYYSDSWQLVINTSTTIVTFLIVFLIQATQNKDTKAVHLKLNELIRAVARARNELVDLEDMSSKELLMLKEEFKKIKRDADEKNNLQLQQKPIESNIKIDKISEGLAIEIDK